MASEPANQDGRATCTVCVEFSAAKRLLDYDGKCHRLHGYTHRVEATFAAKGGAGALVADFYVLKQTLGEWIDANWDHNVILNARDDALGNAVAGLTGQQVFYLPDDPTAETMAAYLKNAVCPELFDGLECVRLRLHDSPSAFVDV